MSAPISPPYWCSRSRRYAIRIEFQHQEFVLSWATASRQPDVSKFPFLDGITSERVIHSEEEKAIWKASQLHSFGSYGQVREAIELGVPFPMYKLAHKSQLSRKLISDGYSTLTNLSSQGLPIVQVDYAFKDKDGIFGFRMERLFRIRPKDISHHYEAIEDAVHQLHEKGYVHADLTFSNIMLNDQGEVRLIDFGHAGKLGEPLPPYHPYRKLKGCQIFEQEIDLLSLKAIRNTGKF